MLHRRDRGVRARGGHAEAGRRRVDLVAVTRPHGDAAVRLEAGEQSRRLPDRDLGPTILPLARRPHLPARQLGHELHPVADAQHRDAEGEELRVRRGSAGIEHRVRPARHDDPLGVELPDEREVGAAGGRVDLAVDVGLPHAARDQLRELRAVVEDQDAVHAPPASPLPPPPRYQVVGSTTSPRSRSSSVSRWRAT